MYCDSHDISYKLHFEERGKISDVLLQYVERHHHQDSIDNMIKPAYHFLSLSKLESARLLVYSKILKRH